MAWALAALVGLFVGLASTFIGLGGGVILVPILPSIFSLSAHSAVATSLFVVALVTGVNCLRFYRQRQLDLGLGFMVGVVASISSFMFGRISLNLSEDFIFQMLAAVLLVLAVFTIYPLFFTFFSSPIEFDKSQRRWIGGFFGILAGFLNGTLGLGGGVIMSPVLLNTRVVAAELVVPTTNLIMFLASVFGSMAFWLNKPELSWPQLGWVRLDISSAIFLCAFITSRIGAKRQAKLNPKLRRVLIALMLLALFCKVWFTDLSG